MNLKKTNLLILAAAIAGFLIGGFCLASPSEEIMGGFSKTGVAAGYPVASGGVPKNTFATAWVIYVNGMVALMGFLFMVFIIYGGFLWMNAHGKEEQVTRAKNMIINASIALGVILAARIIVELVITYLGGTFK